MSLNIKKSLLALVFILLTSCVPVNSTPSIALKELELMTPTVAVINFDKRAIGTGVIVYGGYGNYLVLTAHHVTEDSTNLSVAFKVGGSIYKAKLVKYDQYRDLSLLTVHIPSTNIAPVKTCIEAPQRFEDVIAVGAGFSKPIFPTTGIVANSRWRFQDFPDVNYVQHTAPIAPGNSGGPLFKLENNHYCLAGINLRGFMVEIDGERIPISQFNFAIDSKEIDTFLSQQVRFRKVEDVSP